MLAFLSGSKPILAVTHYVQAQPTASLSHTSDEKRGGEGNGSCKTREWPFLTILLLKIESVVLLRLGFLEYFCLIKQNHDFKPLAAPLYPDMDLHAFSPFSLSVDSR